MCHSLAILGYSLPETDLLAQALLNEVVRSRVAQKGDKLKELYIANPNLAVKERFIRQFTPALGSHGKVFQYADIKEFSERNCGVR